MTVGDRIKELRKNKELAQVELAEKIGVSKQTMYKYENNIVTNIPSDVIELIAKVLNVSEAYLMGWESESLHRLSLDAFYSSEDGHKLISSYLSLNEFGKQNLLDHCDLLLSSKKYRGGPAPQFGQLYLCEGKYTEPYKENEALNAAHERTDIEVTDETQKHKTYSLYSAPSLVAEPRIRYNATDDTPEEDGNALKAAHERTDIEVTDEMRKHDDDIMDGEDF